MRAPVLPKCAKIARAPIVRMRQADDPSNLFAYADARGAWPRRFKQVYCQIVADLGGPDNCTEAALQLVRRATTLCLAAEQLEDRAARGQDIDIDQFGQLSERLARMLARVGLKRQARDVTMPPSLGQYLDQKHAWERPVGNGIDNGIDGNGIDSSDAIANDAIANDAREVSDEGAASNGRAVLAFREGSKKARVYAVWSNEGLQAAFQCGLSIGVTLPSLKVWDYQWRKALGKSKPKVQRVRPQGPARGRRRAAKPAPRIQLRSNGGIASAPDNSSCGPLWAEDGVPGGVEE